MPLSSWSPPLSGNHYPDIFHQRGSGFTHSRILYTWSHKVYSLLCPVSFTQYNASWIHTDDSMVNNLSANAGDSDLIPGSGRSPGRRNGNPLLYSCLGNPMDRGALRVSVHGGHKRVRHNLVTKQQQNVVIYTNSLFVLLSNILLYEYSTICLITHWYLDCLQFGAIMKKTDKH